MEPSHRFTAAHLHAMTRRLFEAAGTPTHIANDVAEILVGSNLAGHDSHGVLRVPAYLKGIEKGEIVPSAEPAVLRETPGTLTVDGRLGFGHYSARWVMARLIEKARQTDICCAALTNHTHIGRLGEYAEQAARAGVIGFTMYGRTGVPRGGTAPYGGATSALSTNPISAGIPTGDEIPFVLDYATSKIAQGKVQVARSKGVDLPAGAILDKHGHPSVKAADYFDGGVLLPVGDHKGYALSLMIALLTGLSGRFDIAGRTISGVYMQAINIAAFVPLEAYQRGVRAVLDGVKATPPAPGFAEVLAPGEPEHRARTERMARGIEVPGTVYREIQQCAGKLGVSLAPDIVEHSDSRRYPARV